MLMMMSASVTPSAEAPPCLRHDATADAATADAMPRCHAAAALRRRQPLLPAIAVYFFS